MKPDSRIDGISTKTVICMACKLALGDGGQHQAQRQARADEQQRPTKSVSGLPQGHVEQQMWPSPRMMRPAQADEDIGDDLADHQFDRPDRRVDQHFHVAALAFAHDGGGGEHDHRHGQDDADQPRHDVDRGALFGIVEQRDLEGRRRPVRRLPEDLGERHARRALIGPAIIVSEPSTIHWATGRLVSSSVEGGVPRPTLGERASRWARSSGMMKAARTRAELDRFLGFFGVVALGDRHHPGGLDHLDQDAADAGLDSGRPPRPGCRGHWC
jgi:hypothetical protein